MNCSSEAWKRAIRVAGLAGGGGGVKDFWHFLAQSESPRFVPWNCSAGSCCNRHLEKLFETIACHARDRCTAVSWHWMVGRWKREGHLRFHRSWLTSLYIRCLSLECMPPSLPRLGSDMSVNVLLSDSGVLGEARPWD